MGLIAKNSGSDLWQNLKNCVMSAIIQYVYVKGTIIRKMSCYCGYILCVTTILKITNYCCNSPLPCNYLILGFHVTSEKTKTKILCFQVKVIVKHISAGLSSTR